MLKGSLLEFPNYDIYSDGRIINRKFGRELKGNVDSKGYRKFMLYENKRRKPFLHHRLMVMCFFPYTTMTEVDHIDRNKLNNELSNLRLADRSLQMCNTGLRKDNKLKLKNITEHKPYGTYRVDITRHHQTVYKLFPTIEEAIRYRDTFFE
tara:strand:+ start:81 stop:533 length:453 start_codon:yes stop_codon:yes gene_type:complete